MIDPSVLHPSVACVVVVAAAAVVAVRAAVAVILVAVVAIVGVAYHRRHHTCDPWAVLQHHLCNHVGPRHERCHRASYLHGDQKQAQVHLDGFEPIHLDLQGLFQGLCHGHLHGVENQVLNPNAL